MSDEPPFFKGIMIAASGIIPMIILGEMGAIGLGVIFWIGTTIWGLTIVFVGIGKIDEQEKKWKSGSTERAIKRESERRERARIQREQMVSEAYTKEEDLDYTGALRIWESLGNRGEAKRIRLKMQESYGRVKVDQTVVQGDYVDDRDTIVKDSVINRSNVGAGGKTKGERIKLIKELLDSGAIDKDDYEKMKREIIG